MKKYESKDVMDRVAAAWDKHSPYPAQAAKLHRVADNMAVFHYGFLKTVPSEDGIERIALMASLDCPQQTLLMIGKTLKDFVPLAQDMSSLIIDATEELLTGAEAEIEYGKQLISRHLSPEETIQMLSNEPHNPLKRGLEK